MKKIAIMFSILGAVFWAMDFQYFQRVAPFAIEKIKDGTTKLPVLNFSERKHHQGVFDTSSDGLPTMTYFASQSAGNKEAKFVAVLPIHGPISKNGDWCSYGTKDYINWLKQANKDPNVDAIVLDVDSPGGTVDGTEELANEIRNSKKPVVSFVDGLAASAAYWSASQSSYIISNSAVSSWIGSIGTFITHIDYAKALDKEGVKVTLIAADKSTEKTLGNPYEPISDEAVKMYKEELNNINDFFISQVKQGRSKKLTSDEVFTGRVYNGEKALGYGLIDKIGTLQDAIDKAALLAVEQAKVEAKSRSSTNIQLASFPFIAKILGSKRKDDEDEEKEKADEEQKMQLAAIEAELKSLTEANASLIEKNASLEQLISVLQNENTSLKNQYNGLKSEYDAISGQPAENFTEIATKIDKINGGKAQESEELPNKELIDLMSDVHKTHAEWKKLGLL